MIWLCNSIMIDSSMDCVLMHVINSQLCSRLPHLLIHPSIRPAVAASSKKRLRDTDFYQYNVNQKYADVILAEIVKIRAAGTSEPGEGSLLWSDYRVAWEKAALLYGSSQLYVKPRAL